MKPYEFTRIYHPSLGRFIYKHKGHGIIVDNIFKGSSILQTIKSIFKPLATKAIKSGSERLGTKLGEKSGDFIMRKLENKFGKQRKLAYTKKLPMQTIPEESTDDIINHLISGSGRK